MDFTVLAVVLLLGIGIPARNKFIRNYRDMKKTKTPDNNLSEAPSASRENEHGTK